MFLTFYLSLLQYEIFSENLNIPPTVPPDWMQQPSPIPRRLTGLSQVGQAAMEDYLPEHADRESRKQKKKKPTKKGKGAKQSEGGDGGDQETTTTIRTRSRAALKEGEEEGGPNCSSAIATRASVSSGCKGEEEGKRPSTRRSTSSSSVTGAASASTSTEGAQKSSSSSQVKGEDASSKNRKSVSSSSSSNNNSTVYVNDGQRPCGSKDHLKLEGLVANGSGETSSVIGDSQDGSSKGAQKSSSGGGGGAKSSKINIGPDVQICQTFHIKNSSSWFLRFGIDYEHKLLGFGNQMGDYSVFYLGQWKDQEALTGAEATAFRQVREMKVREWRLFLV